MLPKPVPVLTDEAAARFEELDEAPLTLQEKEFLKECFEVFKRHPIKE